MAGPTQAPNAPKNQEYGQAGAQLARQDVIPVAGSPTPSRPSTGRPPSSPNTPTNAEMGPDPGQIPSLSDATSRPGEPVTAGLATGAGPGPEALSTASFGPMELSIMRGISLQYPNDDIRRLIEWAERTLA